MVNPQLLDYIKSVREKGHTDDSIKEHLIKHGYSQNIVNDAFKELSPVVHKEKKPFPKKIIYLIVGIIFLAGLGYGVYYFLQVQPFYFSSSVCKDLSIKVYELKNVPVLCVFPDNTKVQMILENNGLTTINSATVLIKGQNSNVEDVMDDLNLVAGDVFTRVIDFDPSEVGTVNKVVITPAVVKNNKKMVCNDNKLTFTEIKSC